MTLTRDMDARSEKTFPNARHETATSIVLGMIAAVVPARAIYCVTELEIPDKLDSGPKSAEELAMLSGCSKDNLERIMHALCTIGVFSNEGGRFGLTDLSRCLRRNAQNGIWATSSFFGREMYTALATLPSTIRAGHPPRRDNTGKESWDLLSSDHERRDVFDEMMSSLRTVTSRYLAVAYPFPTEGRVVDVGGGDGSLLYALLSRHRRLQGTLFDLPAVIDRAALHMAEWPSDLRERIMLVRGDFFHSVPTGGDIYILRHVVHDWADDKAADILRRCRATMAPGSKILVLEAPTDRSDRSWLAWQDIGLMCCSGGKERTSRDYVQMLSDAGFSSVIIGPALQAICVIEASVPTQHRLGTSERNGS